MKPKVISEISLLSMRASAEGMVLLRNMDMLPFKKGDTVAVFGRTQLSYYPYLTVSILNPTKGEIDSVRMKIGDVVSRSCRSTNPNLRNTEPHIWVDGKTPQWYACCPGSRDYTLLANATAEYLSVFELTHERVQNRQHTQKMKGADAHAR